MRKGWISIGVVAGALYFANTSVNAESKLTTASLMERSDIANHLLLLDEVAICTNEEDNEMALADAGVVALKGIDIPTTGTSLPDGTACGFYKGGKLAALLTGRGVQVGGPIGPVIVEVRSQTMGYAYAIIREPQSNVAKK